MKNYIHTITAVQTYPDGKQDSFLCRICNNADTARKLLENLVKEIEGGQQFRHSELSDPVWLNDRHTQLQVTSTIRCGIVYHVKVVYSVHSELPDNVYTNKPWLED